MIYGAQAQSGEPSKVGYAAALGLILLALSLVAGRASAQQSTGAGESALTVATFGGAYGQSQRIAFFDPFTKETGIPIKAETYDGRIALIRAKIGGDASVYDLIDVSQAALTTLCGEGLLEKLDGLQLPSAPDGTDAANDFLAGAIAPCGVASMAWSLAITVDRQAVKTRPSKIADLLDLKRFPGKRALPDGPRYTLELALLADGVTPANIYQELATPAGVDRAFAALDKIKPEIVWWSRASEPMVWLTEKKAVMAAGFSGRIFRASVGNRQRFDVLWNGQIYDLDLWAIPKRAKHKEAAKRFIAFATQPDRLALQAALIAYGPMRKSAIGLVGKHPQLDVEMKGFLPTTPENFQNALKFDGMWWEAHEEELQKRFQAWREQSATAEGAQAATETAPAQ